MHTTIGMTLLVGGVTAVNLRKGSQAAARGGQYASTDSENQPRNAIATSASKLPLEAPAVFMSGFADNKRTPKRKESALAAPQPHLPQAPATGTHLFAQCNYF